MGMTTDVLIITLTRDDSCYVIRDIYIDLGKVCYELMEIVLSKIHPVTVKNLVINKDDITIKDVIQNLKDKSHRVKKVI